MEKTREFLLQFCSQQYYSKDRRYFETGNYIGNKALKTMVEINKINKN